MADTPNRRYVCTSCEEPIRAVAFEMGGDGTYPNGFCVGCSCTLMDSLPYEMGQADTPESWRIEREPCCRFGDVSELDTYHAKGVADYRCPDCGATYRWDGTMAGFPDPTPPSDASRPERPVTEYADRGEP